MGLPFLIASLSFTKGFSIVSLLPCRARKHPHLAVLALANMAALIGFALPNRFDVFASRVQRTGCPRRVRSAALPSAVASPAKDRTSNQPAPPQPTSSISGVYAAPEQSNNGRIEQFTSFLQAELHRMYSKGVSECQHIDAKLQRIISGFCYLNRSLPLCLGTRYSRKTAMPWTFHSQTP